MRGVAAEVVEALLDKIDWTPLPEQLGVRGDGNEAVMATHCGEIVLRGYRLRCFQLSTGQRVFDLDDVEKMFAGTSGAS